MSYSRWSNSSWYTFWDASRSGETQAFQELAVWYDVDHMISWSYHELQNLLSKDHSYVVHLLEMKYECSPDEATEVLDYMQDFINDVNKEFA
jgi:hypothetical protein